MMELGYTTMIHWLSSTIRTQQPQNSIIIPPAQPLLKTVHNSFFFFLHLLSLLFPHLKIVVLD